MLSPGRIPVKTRSRPGNPVLNVSDFGRAARTVTPVRIEPFRSTVPRLPGYNGSMNARTAVLVFDSDCPVCRAAADWVRRNAAVPDAFEYLPCRSAETRRRFPAISEAACLEAMHLVLPDGTILAGGQALTEILGRTTRYRLAAVLLRLP